MLTVRRCLFCLTLCAASMVAHVESAVAQPSNAGQDQPNNSQPRGRSFYTEGAVVAILIGGAVFAVCRSSRRI